MSDLVGNPKVFSRGGSYIIEVKIFDIFDTKLLAYLETGQFEKNVGELS